MAVLEIPPVESAITAVRVSIVAEDFNLFSEHPLIVIWSKAKKRGQQFHGWEIIGFDSIDEAQQFCSDRYNPDKAPEKTNIYAYYFGKWVKVDAVAKSN